MEHAGQVHADQVKRRKGHEGPRNHLITFAISIILTVLAFAAVSVEGISKGFLFTLLLLMAAIQVFVQLGFWMHMKDRGHFWPVLSVIFGVFVVVLVVISVVYWTWFI